VKKVIFVKLPSTVKRLSKTISYSTLNNWIRLKNSMIWMNLAKKLKELPRVALRIAPPIPTEPKLFPKSAPLMTFRKLLTPSFAIV
jgi:hypothetical protein